MSKETQVVFFSNQKSNERKEVQRSYFHSCRLEQCTTSILPFKVDRNFKKKQKKKKTLLRVNYHRRSPLMIKEQGEEYEIEVEGTLSRMYQWT